MTVVCLMEVTTWVCRALSLGTLGLKEALRGKNCVAIATAPLGPEVTGLFKGSTPLTPLAAAADQQGPVHPESLCHGILPVKWVHCPSLS